MAVKPHIGLRLGPRRLGDRLAFGDLDLGLHDIDARHLFGDGMFDLNARIDLDEEERTGVDVHQELDRACAFIADMGADAFAKVADVAALGVGQIGRGGAFDDLLVAPLDGAVAFIEVIDRAVLVAEDLHLDMACAQDHLFKIALAVAEGGLGLAPPFAHLVGQFLGPVDRAHAPPAAAPGRFQHKGIADLGGLLLHKLHVVAQHLGRRDHWHAGLDRHAAGGCLVSQGPHRRGLGADEGDARCVTGLDEIGVLGQQAVSRMNRIRAAVPRDADDLRDREIRTDGRQPLADQIGLVRLEAVERQLVLLGVDRDRLLAQLRRRPHHADRDLAPVGDQDFLELGHVSPPQATG